MSDRYVWLFRIEDILHSIDRIETAIAESQFESYASNEDLQDIVARRFQIIGEAARKIPDDVKKNYSELPWSKMIGMRNFVVHEYNNVDHRIIWDTIEQIFPNLKNGLQALLIAEKEKSHD